MPGERVTLGERMVLRERVTLGERVFFGLQGGASGGGPEMRCA